MVHDGERLGRGEALSAEEREQLRGGEGALAPEELGRGADEALASVAGQTLWRTCIADDPSHVVRRLHGAARQDRLI